ncbi:MAG: cyclic nucleotide-binding domain-containing protein [Kofleriaceae bacterium]|nr:cyclic nucleotide-binding domain-containing protein [Myxococcales bacterium]MCB9559437.1 cyclic nucleotide-binding domain-containing protein [Kofleriaceae bacterium]MCB9574265.1 cyclic nucleotide-binding domain-containing protein [Kofleriaceae bacterium]
MPALAEVKMHAARLFAQGNLVPALRLYDAVVAAAPLDHDARLKVADCLAGLGAAGADDVYRAVAWYAIKAGHPLVALICQRVLESRQVDASELTSALVVHYGCDSELLNRFAARMAPPAPTTEIPVPDLRAAAPDDLAVAAARRAATATADFHDWPEALHPIPLLSALTEAAFRRVLDTLTARRLPAGALAIREGEPGQSFFFVAGGELRVFATDGLGRQTELAHLHEGAVFGEMALLSAQPRSASVEVVGEADLLEVGRASLSALADEIGAVAEALHAFTRDRLLSNLMATSPLFRPFNRQQQRDLLRRFTSHDVAPGTPIIHQGEDARGLFVVLTGEAEVSRLDAGRPAVLGTLRTGDVFGEMALLQGSTTTASVTASRQSTVLFLGREYVERIVANFPEIKKYLEDLAEDRELDNQLALGGDDLDEGEQVLI